jgi:hypothetical protein
MGTDGHGFFQNEKVNRELREICENRIKQNLFAYLVYFAVPVPAKKSRRQLFQNALGSNINETGG